MAIQIFLQCLFHYKSFRDICFIRIGRQLFQNIVPQVTVKILPVFLCPCHIIYLLLSSVLRTYGTAMQDDRIHGLERQGIERGGCSKPYVLILQTMLDISGNRSIITIVPSTNNLSVLQLCLWSCNSFRLVLGAYVTGSRHVKVLQILRKSSDFRFGLFLLLIGYDKGCERSENSYSGK